MKFSLVNNIRALPLKGLTGICPGCSSATRAYCGDRYVHHWKHISTEECDPWYEPITEWHIQWQNQFPDEWQERVIKKDNTFHRADVLTSSDVVLEFQNSPISLSEALQREAFYQKMIWVLNGAAFKDNFCIAMEMPVNWLTEFDEYSLYPGLRPYFVRSKYSSTGNPRVRKGERLYNEKFLGKDTMKNKAIFFWNHPRHTWLKCNMPVFIDFHDDYLWWLRPKFTLTKFSKEEFIQKYNPGKYFLL